MIILLVDQQINYDSLNDCGDILTSIKISVLNFGHNLLDAPGHVVTDLKSAVERVMSYYK